jgi:hypothetical protein
MPRSARRRAREGVHEQRSPSDPRPSPLTAETFRSVSGYFPQDEYEARWHRLSDEMRGQGSTQRSHGRGAPAATSSSATSSTSRTIARTSRARLTRMHGSASDSPLSSWCRARSPSSSPTCPSSPTQVTTDRIVRSEEPNGVKLVTDAMRSRGLTAGQVAPGRRSLPSVAVRAHPGGRAPGRRAAHRRRAGGVGATHQVRAGARPPDVGSVGIEQNIIVHADGTELLTPVPLEWW